MSLTPPSHWIALLTQNSHKMKLASSNDRFHGLAQHAKTPTCSLSLERDTDSDEQAASERGDLQPMCGTNLAR